MPAISNLADRSRTVRTSIPSPTRTLTWDWEYRAGHSPGSRVRTTWAHWREAGLGSQLGWQHCVVHRTLAVLCGGTQDSTRRMMCLPGPAFQLSELFKLAVTVTELGSDTGRGTVAAAVTNSDNIRNRARIVHCPSGSCLRGMSSPCGAGPSHDVLQTNDETLRTSIHIQIHNISRNSQQHKHFFPNSKSSNNKGNLTSFALQALLLEV